jgi:hypothetical protein
VTIDTTEEPCDSLGNKCTLFYPDVKNANANLPIVTWGNGTFARPEDYTYFLRHLASWGFVVIATQGSDNFADGKGKPLLDAARLLVRANDDPSLLKGVFYKKLDVDQIAAVGHSQGAEAAIGATMLSEGKIKTAIPIELPNKYYCLDNCVDTAQFNKGSIFFVTGTDDLIAPPLNQCPCDNGPTSVSAYYDNIPTGVSKVMGALFPYGHNDIQGQPDCNWIVYCLHGVYGYLGYPTAWLMFQMQGDKNAGIAFVTPNGEIFSDGREWFIVESNIRR